MIIFGLLKFIYSEKATKLFVLASQIIGGYFSKFCGLLRIYEFYTNLLVEQLVQGGTTSDMLNKCKFSDLHIQSSQ